VQKRERKENIQRCSRERKSSYIPDGGECRGGVVPERLDNVTGLAEIVTLQEKSGIRLGDTSFPKKMTGSFFSQGSEGKGEGDENCEKERKGSERSLLNLPEGGGMEHWAAFDGKIDWGLDSQWHYGRT